jgi:dihydropteroate synthase
MGVLNVTPDSFYDAGAYATPDKAIAHGLRLASEGADILDIGGESTRPFATPVSEAVESERVIPVVAALATQIAIPISVETYKASVARAALAAGARWINDVYGFQDPQMKELLADSGAVGVVMHMQGTPQTMQKNPVYSEGVVPMVYAWFQKRLEELLTFGVRANRLVIDPGIGFGKTLEQNLELLRALPRLKQLGFPLLVGASRKSFLQKILKKEAKALLSASVAIHTMALAAHADVIRVHDVADHRDAVDLFIALQQDKNGRRLIGSGMA